jgi:hypothetical protein
MVPAGLSRLGNHLHTHGLTLCGPSFSDYVVIVILGNIIMSNLRHLKSGRFLHLEQALPHSPEKRYTGLGMKDTGSSNSLPQR